MDTGALLLLATQIGRIYLDMSVMAGIMTKEEAEAHWAETSARAKTARERYEEAKKAN